MNRDFQRPGRSAVYATEGLAATSHPLATQTAIATLRAGGTAADAAVAAVAVLCVVEPHMTGIGGDCFTLIATPGRPVWGYNGSGRAAKTASTERLREAGIHAIGGDSIHAVTVPGAVEAWEAILQAHGTFSLAQALAPAIGYAQNGFPVAPRVARDWAQHVARLRADPGAAHHYLKDGQAPRAGDIWHLPALAATLRIIADKGARAFYEGEIADDLCATLAPRGSLLSHEDFATHRGDVVTPISTLYRDREVVEIPPNGQGVAALALLNIMENFDFAKLGMDSAERFHIQLEAARLAYALRDTHLADIEHMRVTPRDLIDKDFARRLAALIDPDRRVSLPRAPAPGSNTVYVTVVDRDRRAVSLINSLYASFGVGIATEKTGILLTNRGACFVVDPSHPNTFGPGKRPMHTIIPALAMRAGRCELSFGVMGGDYQPMGQAQVVANRYDFGLDIQAAIDAPRAFFDGDTTVVERGLPEKTIAGLRARGHTVAFADAPLGGGQGIEIDWQRGVMIGGSDPRKDGCALGY